MKQITNKEYREWVAYKEEKAKHHIMMPDTIRFICESCHYDAAEIGRYFLELLPTVCPNPSRPEVIDDEDPEVSQIK